MKASFDPTVPVEKYVTDESLALARWYDTHPSIRRLLGVRVGDELRVIVAIDPTLDGDDILPVWLASTRTWSKELRGKTGRSVRLELAQYVPGDGIEIDPGSRLIADLSWRDATFNEPPGVVPPTTITGVLDSAIRESASRIFL